MLSELHLPVWSSPSHSSSISVSFFSSIAYISCILLAWAFLATLYELRSVVGFEKKKELLVDVAKWSGDGLKTNCLKMPAN